jgi:hypothetical protein
MIGETQWGWPHFVRPIDHRTVSKLSIARWLVGRLVGLVQLRLVLTLSPCVVLLSVLAFSACTVPPPSEFQPSKLTPQAAATIEGSLVKTSNPLLPDAKVILVAVDGQMTGLGWQSWNTQVLVKPGQHLIEFGPCLCNYLGKPYFGFVALNVSLLAGHTYILRSTAPKSAGLLKPRTTIAWIEDGSGASVTPLTTFSLNGPGSASAPVMVMLIPVK